MTAELEIDYDALAQEAMRGVVRAVLTRVQKTGLPGDHHFYITFKTQAAGVVIPTHLAAKFPDEMTIVLQNRYWDLQIEQDHFSVGLSFNQIPSTLVIPYSAITAFVDPSVDFGLQFHVDDSEWEEILTDEDGENDRVDTASEDGSNVVTVDFGKKR